DVNAPGAQQAAEVFGEVSGEIAEVRTEAQQTQQRIDDLGDELDRTGSRGVSAFGNLRSTLLGLGAALGVGIGLREVVTQLRDAVLAASDLEQSIGGVQAIFGTSADEVLRFGEAADQAVGLSADAFNQLTAQLGAQLQSYGFAVDEAATKSIELVELGADLAATFGGPVSDAVAAIGSLLRGEINPIERYGVA